MDQVAAAADIYSSKDALDAYLASVRERREERKHGRAEAERLTACIDKVNAERAAAEQDGDGDIAAELSAILSEFERRRASVHVGAGIVTETAVVYDVVATEPLVQNPAAAVALTKRAIEVLAVIPTLPSSLAPDTNDDSSKWSPEKLDSVMKHCTEAVGQIAVRVGELEADARQDDGPASRAHQLNMRAEACMVGQVHAEAREFGLSGKIDPSLDDLRNRLDFVRGASYSDYTRPLPFNEMYWSDHADALSASQWQELSSLYAAASDAQEALDWYTHSQSDLGNQTKLDLLNSIGARQQMLFRTLDDYGDADRMQAILYGSIRDAGSAVGYLNSLNAETRWEDLERLASELPALLASAHQDVLTSKEKDNKAARREDAIAAVLAWGKRTHGSPRSLDDDRATLLPLLDECLIASVPPTNTQIRSELLSRGQQLLDGLPQYSKVLDAVMAERKRQGLDAVDEDLVEEEDDEPSDTVIEEFKTVVSPFTNGKNVLILGGVTKPQICADLKQAVGCADVKWLGSKKSDKASKFQPEIRRADILIVVKNYAGHDMSEKGREWMREVNGHFILLPSGYGVNQIIHQLYKYVAARESRA